jgi:hypothetical protein
MNGNKSAIDPFSLTVVASANKLLCLKYSYINVMYIFTRQQETKESMFKGAVIWSDLGQHQEKLNGCIRLEIAHFRYIKYSASPSRL